MTQRAALFFLVLMCCTSAFAAQRVVLLNMSPSMPRGVWRTHPVSEEDELVSLTPPPEAITWGCVRRTQVLIKRVWAREGETVCQHGRVLYKRASPTRLVRTSLLTSQGELLTLGWKGCQTLKKDELFVLGQHPSSCDSRFFGPVHTSRVRARVSPLWIWDPLQEAP